MVSFWEPRIGKTAAVHTWRSKWVSTLVPIVVLADFIIVFVSVRLHFQFAWGLAWILGSASVVFAGSALLYTFLSWRAASRYLGIRIHSYPPMGDAAYRAWCKEMSIKPFSAGDDATTRRSPES
jgi:hypothetical protein